MTSPTFKPNPNFIKMDRRFALYKEGFRVRIDFTYYTDDQTKLYDQCVQWCVDTWGPQTDWGRPGPVVRNPNWRTNWVSTHGRQLYLQSDQAITMLLLAVDGFTV